MYRTLNPTTGELVESFDTHGDDDVARALAGCDPERPVVLLAHQPRIIDDAADHGVGLVLSFLLLGWESFNEKKHTEIKKQTKEA